MAPTSPTTDDAPPAPEELVRWVRRLTVGLARLAEPPTRVEARLGAGLVLRLGDARGGEVSLWLTPAASASAAFFRGRVTALRYLGLESLAPHHEAWARGVAAGVQRAERRPGWEAFLERAARAGAAPAAGAPAMGRVTSGDAALLRITTRCQARCAFCSSRGVLHDCVDDLPGVRRQVARALADGRQTVSFTGGEPTLRPDLPALVAAARAEGIPGVELQTNGIRLARRAYVARLAEAGVTSLFLSLHGEAAIHDALLEVPGAHAKALAGAAHALATGMLVFVNHVTTTRNLAGLPAFVEALVARLPPTGIRLSVMSPEGGGAEHLAWIPRLDEVAPVFARAIDLGRAAGLDMKIPGLCGVPPCVLPGYPAHFEELLDAVAPPRLLTRRQGGACPGCVHRTRCSGYWTAYLDRHGDAELRPFSS